MRLARQLTSLLILPLVLPVILLATMASAQQLDTEPSLPPLFPHSDESNASTPTSPPSKKPLVLQGSVKTLDAAIEAERGTVNWYQWYLNARDYLSRTGGLPCELGTDIKFYKSGRIEALTPDPVCRLSLNWRNFPLPPETQLDAVILPVRSGAAPPASPEELMRRIQGHT